MSSLQQRLALKPRWLRAVLTQDQRLHILGGHLPLQLGCRHLHQSYCATISGPATSLAKDEDVVTT